MSFSRASGWRGCWASTLISEYSPRGEIDRLVAVGRAVRADRSSVHGPKRDHAVVGRGDAWRRALRAPAQHRMDARHEFARIEGLGQVVVGADLQADDAVHVVALGGEHDDGHGLACARAAVRQRARPSSPGSIRSSTIRCGRCAAGSLVELRGVCRRLDIEALFIQVARQQVAQAHVVVDDQDPGLRSFGVHPSLKRAGMQPGADRV